MINISIVFVYIYRVQKLLPFTIHSNIFFLPVNYPQLAWILFIPTSTSIQTILTHNKFKDFHLLQPINSPCNACRCSPAMCDANEVIARPLWLLTTLWPVLNNHHNLIPRSWDHVTLTFRRTNLSNKLVDFPQVADKLIRRTLRLLSTSTSLFDEGCSCFQVGDKLIRRMLPIDYAGVNVDVTNDDWVKVKKPSSISSHGNVLLLFPWRRKIASWIKITEF